MSDYVLTNGEGRVFHHPGDPDRHVFDEDGVAELLDALTEEEGIGYSIVEFASDVTVYRLEPVSDATKLGFVREAVAAHRLAQGKGVAGA